VGRHNAMIGAVAVFLLLILKLMFSTYTETHTGYTRLHTFFQRQIEIVSAMGSSLTGFN